ncbi:MerR family transcriptional regulator [[Mycobacterium] burgundiense]|uniref:MerR family transcriptional regulator n=1 Tax=[Mycobacterium] burgundiense TaxID=3064286 RepID=A0ABM9LVD2_9MYCO|nr:MerR family transcriptional regulator [Mycolicibacterium sp. MU0053]CAJ1505376.1 MerR family transcriptional regulator [Mycolicibacterium sp. MU0053]
MVQMRISQLAQRSGVPASTLRFYESVGLLPSERTDSGYRVYDDESVQRLGFIRAAKQVGLPLEEIRELLAVWDEGACVDVRGRMRPMITARLDEVVARIAELQRFAEVLTEGLDRLDALPDRAEPCDARCSFLRTRQGLQEISPAVARR